MCMAAAPSMVGAGHRDNHESRRLQAVPRRSISRGYLTPRQVTPPLPQDLRTAELTVGPDHQRQHPGGQQAGEYHGQR